VGTNLYGCLKQLYLLKKKNRHLHILLSVGGWTYSSNFAAPASTPNGRVEFARSAVSLVKQLGIDGIDIDWEYPKDSAEAQNYVLLLRECRHALDDYGKSLSVPQHFELTVACPAGAQNYEKLDLKAMDQYLDFWNLMAYDFAGSWDSTAGHQANLYKSTMNPQSTPFSIQEAIKHYIDKGVASNKIVLGMPIYGRAFEGTGGPGQAYNGVGQGTWENGVHDYCKLPLEGSKEVQDDQIGASWSYDEGKKTMVSYGKYISSPISQQTRYAFRDLGLVKPFTI
jgi:chitinase